MGWTPASWSTRNAEQPAFLQISHAIVRDIRGGRLRKGERLPSSRRLAAELGVHRNTVLSAFAELEAQGWIESEQGRGTFVSAQLPETIRAAPAGACEASYRILPAPEVLRNQPEEGILSMAGGTPDTRLVPSVELARAIKRALRRGSRLLDYGAPEGTIRLRRAIAQMLRDKRGMLCSEDSVLMTRGSQMGIYLVGQALLRPGDRVAVESIGYRPAWQALRMSGARLAPVPVDEAGMQIESLEALHQRRKIRAVYLTPHHQFPTLVTLSASRRLALLEFARRHRVAVLEDDYDHEFHYEGRPVLPMAANDSSGNVIYVGTLSKVLAPGLRIGYVVGPPRLIQCLAALRSHIDSHGDAVTESAVAEWIEEGDLERHARRVRKIYLARREALLEALQAELGAAVRYRIPSGGMALWIESVKDLDVDAWAQRALAAGVRVSPASCYRFDRRNRAFLRAGFAKLDPEELRRAVQILARTQRPGPRRRPAP